ncbi:hypothetical protein AB0G35_01990 [Streptomyces sp. NPDC021749]|uniref:hypothetical protein n=1 Tax=Streptomyces sp. NPDC021749 TaxID=3154905 RepID=UPI0033F40386
MVVMTRCRSASVDLKLTLRGLFSGQSTDLTDTTNPTGTMLDIPSLVRVHVEALIAEQHDMGVCDAIEEIERPNGSHNVTQQKAALPHKQRPELEQCLARR